MIDRHSNPLPRAKVVQGLAKLAKAEVNKEQLVKSGILQQLLRCLSQDNTDGRLHHFALCDPALKFNQSALIVDVVAG